MTLKDFTDFLGDVATNMALCKRLKWRMKHYSGTGCSSPR